MTGLRTALAALALTLTLAAPALAADAPAAAAPKVLTQADVEKIVHDYIINNAEVILTSVDDYQKRSQRENQDAALKKNKEAVFNDADAPMLGNPKGDVTIVEFMDYNCHYCKQSFPTVMALIEKDKNIRFIMKDFPILGPSSETAAKWALAAQKQKKYFEFHKAMMEHKGPITDDGLEKAAKAAGMDVALGKKDSQSTDVMLQIEKNRNLAASLGLSGTPAFIVGDQIAFGAYSQEDMEKMIKDARTKKPDTAPAAAPAPAPEKK